MKLQALPDSCNSHSWILARAGQPSLDTNYN